MRKIFLAVMFVALTVTQTCAAKDIWVENHNGVDVYVMNETITGNQTDTGAKQFTVSTKLVRNGQLVQTVHWNFDKFRTDDWQYTNSNAPDDRPVKIPYRNPLFEYCMNYLGWSYRLSDRNGTKYYH